MNKNRPLFRRAAGIAVLALVLQVFLPLLHPVMAADAAIAIDHGLRHCSVTTAHLSKARADKTTQQKAPSCPICIAMHLMAAGYVPPQDFNLKTIHYSLSVLMPLQDAFIVSLHGATNSQPRAPPSLT